jgi:hypothetical protein
MKIEDLRKICNDETIEVTRHALDRFMKRGINYSDVKNAIMTGEIIEPYPEDYRHPSCLILGATLRQSIIHVVVGWTEKKLWIVTAYYPDIEMWSDDFKTRKVK